MHFLELLKKGQQLSGALRGFPSDHNTSEKAVQLQDRGHVGWFLTANPPPQRGSPCVGSADLSPCEQPSLSLSQLELTSALHHQSSQLRSGTFTFYGLKQLFFIQHEGKEAFLDEPSSSVHREFLPDARVLSASLMHFQTTRWRGSE